MYVSRKQFNTSHVFIKSRRCQCGQLKKAYRKKYISEGKIICPRVIFYFCQNPNCIYYIKVKVEVVINSGIDTFFYVDAYQQNKIDKKLVETGINNIIREGFRHYTKVTNYF